MKAIVQDKYGSPEVLELQEIDKPVVKDNEVLIRVHTAGVNAADWHFMRGEPNIMRLMSGLRTPKNKVLGRDVAGTVEAVGANVTCFSQMSKRDTLEERSSLPSEARTTVRSRLKSE